MEVSVSMAIMSILSDVQENPTGEVRRINFAKYLLLKHPNTNELIDVNAAHEEFKVKHPNMV